MGGGGVRSTTVFYDAVATGEGTVNVDVEEESGGGKGKRLVRHVDIPTILNTDCLLLRVPAIEDAPAVYEALLESALNLRPWLVWARTKPSLERCQHTILQAQSRFVERLELRYYMFDKVDEKEEFIGSISLQNIDWHMPKFEIGFWVRSSREGSGYVTEAVRGIASVAIDKLGARRIEIVCNEQNTKSRKVADRAGFQLEKVIYCDFRASAGSLRNTAVYSLCTS